MGRANFCSLSQVDIDADGNCRDYNPLRNLRHKTNLPLESGHKEETV